MKEQAIITSLQKKWKVLSLLSLALIALAAALVFVTCLHQLFQYAYIYIVPAWLMVFAVMIAIQRSWRIQQKDVLVYLNRNVAALEESSELLLKPSASLNLLEQMQVHKLQENIQQADAVHPVNKRLKSAVLVLLLSILASALIFLLSNASTSQGAKNNSTGIIPSMPQQVLPAVASVSIQIKPPAYTNIRPQVQQDMNVVAAEGSTVSWQIETTKPVPQISLQFSDTTLLQLHPLNKERTKWRSEKTVKHAGFYQVQLNSGLSDLYKLEMISDQPPAITVQSPKPNTVIDFGEPQRISVQVNVSDDYGVTNATVMATVASGSGEAVKFSEHTIPFPGNFSTRNKNYALKKNIDLPSLGMKPGDELYLYIKAGDNNNQATQSDTYIISIADTAELMSFDGIVNSVNIKPEYFRSQRQIIIETEQLLRDKPALTQDAFNNKSNDLGIDQKLLRLRYGKFLGEEFEANIGGHGAGESHDEHGGHEEHDEHEEHDDHHDHHEHGKPGENNNDFGNAEAVISQFEHKHDVAEDASFFDPETKKQLRAVLTEMWNAELRLRTFKPEAALPFEYKALRLLKDLQQQSRVYVAKTNIKTPPLKPETRLTGELDKIISPSTKNTSPQKDEPVIAGRQTLSILEGLKTNPVVGNHELALLLTTSRLMQQQAALTPGKYLAALQSYQRILNQLQQKQNIGVNDINTAQQGLQQMLAVPPQKPLPAIATGGNSLSQQYFLNLDKQKP